MRTYGTRLIVSLVAFIALIGGIFIYVARSTGKSVVQAPDTSATAGQSTDQTVAQGVPVISRPSESESEGGEVSEDDGGSAPAAKPVVPPATQVPVTVPASSKYKNGTYSAVGSYQSPEGFESINVSVTLKSGVVTDSSVTGNATGGYSHRYQQYFISGYKQYVIGQNIDSISLGQVSGSSLTSGGFNDALTKIKAQARA